ncbi:hypothetical protein DSO57_1035469 [Entomophthora muscae]|uniref:Uncharacterized protein n=1 Tax=Entomophthora muscae TaxID=34485 RepID=A0ACC2TAE2_9FUNG|nr:hypothetical protein DSO57_1035469 [Entomophthora muscae]
MSMAGQNTCPTIVAGANLLFTLAPKDDGEEHTALPLLYLWPYLTVTKSWLLASGFKLPPVSS